MVDFAIMPYFKQKLFYKDCRIFQIHPSPKQNYNFKDILYVPKEILFLLPCQGRNQLIVWFASVLPSKMGRVGGWKPKSSDFLNKKTYILLVGYLTCSAKQMLFQLPIYHQNKDEEVCFYSTNSLYIYLYYLYLFCVFYLCLVRFQLVVFLCFSFYVLTIFQLVFIGDKLG